MRAQAEAAQEEPASLGQQWPAHGRRLGHRPPAPVLDTTVFCRPTSGHCQMWWSRCVTQVPHCMATPHVALDAESKETATETLAFQPKSSPCPLPQQLRLRRACKPQQGANVAQQALSVNLFCLPVTYHCLHPILPSALHLQACLPAELQRPQSARLQATTGCMCCAAGRL